MNKLALSILVFAFQLFVVGCNNGRNHSVPESDSTKVQFELVAGISDSLFPYASFHSSFDEKMFRIDEHGFNDTLVNGEILTDLPINEKRKLLGILAKELGSDSGYIEKFVRVLPISKFNSYHGAKQMVFVLEGDDLWGMLLINQNKLMKLTYSTLLAGGIAAGAEYENDSVFVGPPVIRSKISSDTLWKYVIYSAERMQRHPQDSLKPAVISDTGVILFRLSEGNLDTLRRTGLISVDSFVKYKIH
ncbi:MAG: hypothetical protein IPP69_16650 [Flavobacteriales bacterium]|nr:hypothetical protein [Flavobacteriales bacterium]